MDTTLTTAVPPTPPTVPHRLLRIADAILLVGVVFVVLVLTYEIANAERFFRGVFLAFVIAPLLGGIMLLAVRLRARPAIRVQVALVAVMCVVVLSAAEGVLTARVWLRATGPLTDSGAIANALAARAAGIPFDTRSKIEVLTALRAEGSAVHPVVSRRAIMLDGARVQTLGGISAVPTLFCNEGGSYVVYESDEYGFNNPRGLHASGAVDALALGDSFTHGACVSPEANMLSVVRAQYPQTVNLGIGGMNPLMQLATLREYGQPLRPRVVLWVFFEGNDLRGFMDELSNTLLTAYRDAHHRVGLPERQAAIDRALTAIGVEAYAEQEEFRASRAVVASRVPGWNFLTLHEIRLRIAHVVWEAQYRRGRAALESTVDLDAFRSVLMRARDDARAWGGTMAFVYLPSWERYAHREQAESHRDAVLAIARELALPTVDIHTAFLAYGDPLGMFQFRLRNHYSEEGYRVAGAAIIALLDELL